MPIEETLIGKLRREFQPRLPKVLTDVTKLKYTKGEKTQSVADQDKIAKLFPVLYGQPIVDIATDEKAPECKPLKIGVVLSGGQASGGHNVITGIYDAVKSLNKNSTLIGFLDGPRGIMNNKFIKLEADFLDKYRNTGGFDMIASGRDKIESVEQQEQALKAVNANDLDGLVVIGGDDSNTNAAILAEFFASKKSKCCVVGVPKTIDGDLQNEYIEVSFGFDTAVKEFSHMISNLCRDSVSAKKAWHFVKLMGRDASQVTVDVALQTHPCVTLVGEEIQKENLTMADVVEKICDVIAKRAAAGRNYGVIIIPEGIVSFIPSMKRLLDMLTEELKDGSKHLAELEKIPEMPGKIDYVRKLLAEKSKENLANFDVLPSAIQGQLLLERDPHGNIQMSQIPTEQLFIAVCEKRLAEKKKAGEYVGKLRAIGHFFGYDGRSGFPSNFDAQYCYSLGRVAACLISQKYNGYMSRVYNLELDVTEWGAGGIPISMLLNMERRHGKDKPVIKKCLIDVEKGNKFLYFKKHRASWELEDGYRYVAGIQYFGPTDLTDVPPMNVLLKKTNDVVWPLKK